MDIQELVKFLKDNLEVEVSNDCGGDFTVSLRLCGEIISSGSYQSEPIMY